MIEPPSDVLIVEDDVPTQKLLRTVVEHLGLRAASARNGARALEMLRKQPFRVVLLDLLMPDVDGFTVLHEIRAFSPELLSRVLVITALADIGGEVSSECRNVRRVLKKPIDIRELMSEIRDCCGITADAPPLQVSDH